MRSPIMLAVLFIMLFSPLHIIKQRGGSIPEPGDTVVDSDITSDQTWNAASSPYIISGNIKIVNGTTLRILGGSSLRFEDNSSMTVEGGLVLGEDGGKVTITSVSQPAPGRYQGLILDSPELIEVEGAVIDSSSIGLDVNNTSYAVIRNSTFSSNLIDIRLANSSRVLVENCTLNFTRTVIVDGTSLIETSVLFSGSTVDFRGDPAGAIRIDVFDDLQTLRLSYITNETGIIPPILLKGRSLTSSGWNDTPGDHLFSLSDDPVTHYINISQSVQGTGPIHHVLRFYWAPEILGIPEAVKVNEDQVHNLYVQPMDRNGAGNLTIIVDSPRISYHRDENRIEFLYMDESVLEEIVNVTVDDTYDSRMYALRVVVTPRDDPPVLGLGSFFVTIMEGVEYTVDLTIEDEDTPIENITITTSDPVNTRFDRLNSTLVLLYRDGTDEYFNIDVTASDGTSNDTQTLLVRFIDIKHPPIFSQDLPHLILDEDTTASIDLDPYVHDPDVNDEVRIYLDTLGSSIFSAYLNGTMLSVSPFRDMNGHGRIQLILVDSGALSTTGYLDVTVLPVNDPPYIANGGVIAQGGGVYRFNVTFFDVDGDMPESVSLLIDDTEYAMQLMQRTGSTPLNGLEFIIDLEPQPGEYIISFRASDGQEHDDMYLGPMVFPIVIHTDFMDAYGGGLVATVLSTGKGASPQIDLSDDPSTAPSDLIPLGCNFRITAADRILLLASVRITIGTFRGDVLGSMTGLWYLDDGNWSQAPKGSYDRIRNTLTVDLEYIALNSTLSLMGILDPEYDSDGDGVINLLDAFPLDPNEWLDTDGDGIGDNQDDDDDGDGFPDEVEIAAGTDPKNPLSYPLDTDDDGVLDYLDDDDDGDGIPDEWELLYGLDPLNPADSLQDWDDDGYSNLEEYLRGTNPLIPDVKQTRSIWGFVMWIAAGILLLLLIATAAAFIIASLKRDREDFEIEDEHLDEDWEVKGELDPGEALVCLGCSEVYPLVHGSCPFCGSEKARSYAEE